jgi:hypothetical protein
VMVFLLDRVLQTMFPGLVSLLLSASCVARIKGMSHQHLAPSPTLWSYYICVLWLICVFSLCNLNMNPLSDIYFANIFSQFIGCLLVCGFLM